MPHYLSDDELKRTSPAEIGSFRSPVPTQIVSNGEYNPLPQTREQQKVEARIKDLATVSGADTGWIAAGSWRAPPAWRRPSSP